MVANTASATGKMVVQTSDPGAAKDTSADLRRMSTEDVAEKDRPNSWQHVVCGLIGGFELRDYECQNFDSSLGLTTVGDLKIGHLTGVSQELERSAEPTTSSNPDSFSVVPGATHTFEQIGRPRPDDGGVVLIDMARPYRGNHTENLDVIDVFIPRTIMERALGPTHQAAALTIEACQPSFPIIMAFLRSLCHQGASLGTASAARLSAIAVDLIASGFAEKMGQAPSRHASGAPILCRAQAYIAENLGVSGLGMLEVAAKLNISVRRLHQIAADDGISLVDWMWERRLQRARTMLADTAQQSLSVGGIAYQCGFVDPAHFSRRFKLRFGQAPSEVRAPPQRGGV